MHTARYSIVPLLSAAFCLVACTPAHTCIQAVTDLPLKEVVPANMAWQVSSIRAHAQYVLYGAQSEKERRSRLGDYYFVEWYDAEPDRPVKLEMLYTQALTASQVLTRSVEFNTPRPSAGSRKTHFFFNGDERAKRGDVMTWQMRLYVDGRMVDSRSSFLWSAVQNTASGENR